jgi:hypothetical protein
MRATTSPRPGVVLARVVVVVRVLLSRGATANPSSATAAAEEVIAWSQPLQQQQQLHLWRLCRALSTP